MSERKEPTMAELYSHPELNIKKKRKWGWTLIIFFIYSSFKNVNIDEGHLFTGVFLLLSLVGAPFFYYWAKSKVKKIKNEKYKSFIVGLFVIIIFIIAIGILGTLGDRIILKTPSDQVIQEKNAIIQKTSEVKVWFQDWQVRWDKTQANIIDDTGDKAQYSINISNYKVLQELNIEKYNKTKELFDVLAKYLPLFSNYDMRGVYTASEKLRDSYDELFKAKIDYFQALLNNKSDAEIEASRLLVNEKASQATTAENDAQSVMVGYNKALTEISGN